MATDFNIIYNLRYHLHIKQNISQDEPAPAFYWNTVQMNRARIDWSEAAKKVLRSANAGGNSILSEAFSAEVLCRLYGAGQIRTEMEVEYLFSNWKIADFCINVFHKNVGVSVTRAATFIPAKPFQFDTAVDLLERKIHGLILARNGISERDAFYTSILHILCDTKRTKNLLFRAYKQLSPALKDNIIILCTVAECADFVFRNPAKLILI